MYPNLAAEMARNGIKRKEIAEKLDVRIGTIYDKLNGKYSLTLDEAFFIRETFFPNHTLEYLFAKSAITGLTSCEV